MASMDLARLQALTAVQQLLELTKDKSTSYRQHVQWSLAPSLMAVERPPPNMRASERALLSERGRAQITRTIGAESQCVGLLAFVRSVCPQASP